MNSFMQSEINHELYGSSATPSPQRFEQGYSRSIMGNPYEQQPSGYGSLLSGRSLGGMGGMGGPLGGLYQPRYQGGLFGNYGNSAMMQLARLYASQPLASTIPGEEKISIFFFFISGWLISRALVFHAGCRGLQYCQTNTQVLKLINDNLLTW